MKPLGAQTGAHAGGAGAGDDAAGWAMAGARVEVAVDDATGSLRSGHRTPTSSATTRVQPIKRTTRCTLLTAACRVKRLPCQVCNVT